MTYREALEVAYHLVQTKRAIPAADCVRWVDVELRRKRRGPMVGL